MFEWNGKRFDPSKYAVDSPAPLEEPPKLSREDYNRLTDSQKREYMALTRAWQRVQLAKKMAKIPGFGKLDPYQAKIKVVNEQGRTLDKRDFNLMRDSVLAMINETKELKKQLLDRIEKEKDVTKRDEFIKLASMVTKQLESSVKFEKGRGGYSGGDLNDLIEGFEKIDKVADELDQYLINSERINAWFKKNQIDTRLDLAERSKFAKILQSVSERTGISVKDAAKKAPTELTTTGGLTTLALSSLGQMFGPLGQMATMMVNIPELAEQVEKLGAKVTNKGLTWWGGRKVAKQLAVGQDATEGEAVADDMPRIRPDATPAPLEAEQLEGRKAVEAAARGELTEETLEEVLRKALPENTPPERFEVLLKEFAEGVTEGLHEEFAKAADLFKDEGDVQLVADKLAESVDQLLKEHMGDALPQDAMAQMGKLVTGELKELLVAQSSDIASAVASAVETPVESRPMSAADQRNFETVRDKDRARDEAAAREKTESFLTKKLDAIIDNLEKIALKAGEGGGLLGGGGMGGLLSGLLGGAGGLAGLKALRDRLKAGKLAGAGKGMFAKLGGMFKGVKGKGRAGALLALLAGGTAWAMGDEDEEDLSADASPVEPTRLAPEGSALRVLEENSTAVGLGASILSGAGKLAGKVFTPIAAGATAYDQYQQVKDREDLSAAEKAGNVVGATGGVMAGAVGGAIAGQAIIPIPVVGAGVGAIAGSIAGSELGQRAGQAVGSGYDSAVNWTSGVLDWITGEDKKVYDALAPIKAPRNRNKSKHRPPPFVAPAGSTTDNAPTVFSVDTSAGPAKSKSRGLMASLAGLLPRGNKATSVAVHESKSGIKYTPETQAAEKAVDAASSSMGGGTGAFAAGGKAVGAVSAISALGHYIKKLGYRVGGHREFGGVESWRAPDNPHALGEAIDINAGPGQSPQEMRKLDELYAHLKPLHDAGQILLWWRKPAHYDHMHIQIPKGKRGWGDKDPGLLTAMTEMGIPINLPMQQGSGGAVSSPTTPSLASAEPSLVPTSATGAATSASPVAASTAVAVPSSLPNDLGTLPNSQPVVNVNVEAPSPGRTPQQVRVPLDQPGIRDANFAFDDSGLNAASMGVV